MILHLGENVSVESRDIVAVLDLTKAENRISGAMMREIRKQNRLFSREGMAAKSAVICAGAVEAGGVYETPRVYLSPISTQTLFQRTRDSAYRYYDRYLEAEESGNSMEDGVLHEEEA